MEARVVPGLRKAFFCSADMITTPLLSWSLPQFFGTIAVTVICLLLVMEQLVYLKKKRFVPAPSFVIPFLGSTVPMISNPKKNWRDLGDLGRSSGHGFYANYLFGRFIAFIQDSELTHNVFTNVKPDAFMCVGHPFGKKLFGEHNLIYMFGEKHKDLRRRIAPNFSVPALSTYLFYQQCTIA